MRIGSRGSALALAQAEHVAGLIGGAEIVTIRTTGDLQQAGPAHRPAGPSAQPAGAAGPASRTGSAPSVDKSRWVDAIERALVDGKVDLAVHSAKDLPGELAPGLALLGAPPRAPVEDVVCGVRAIAQLPAGAAVGTCSLRRAAQLLSVRADLRVLPLAGNVDTRLARLKTSAAWSTATQRPAVAGGPRLDAVILARAGLVRLRREAEIGGVLDATRHVPSPGQGALALEGRAGDGAVAEAVAAITDPDALACLRAERALAGALEADCHTPLGAHARPDGTGRLLLRAWIGLPDGSEWISDEQEGAAEDPDGLGARVAERMRTVGAAEMLRRAREMAALAEVSAP